MSYVSGTELNGLLAAHIKAKTAADYWRERHDQLTKTVTSRRKRRIRRGSVRKDRALIIAERMAVKCVAVYRSKQEAMAALIYQIAEQFWTKFNRDGKRAKVEAEDAIQIAVTHAVQQAHRFDESLGSGFNWLTKVIQNKFLEVCRNEQRLTVNHVKFVDRTGRGREHAPENDSNRVADVTLMQLPNATKRRVLVGASCERRQCEHQLEVFFGNFPGSRARRQPATRGRIGEILDLMRYNLRLTDKRHGGP
jgi:DNA-directed RNA polymerase specialized sigma24 family protein